MLVLRENGCLRGQLNAPELGEARPVHADLPLGRDCPVSERMDDLLQAPLLCAEIGLQFFVLPADGIGSLCRKLTAVEAVQRCFCGGDLLFRPAECLCGGCLLGLLFPKLLQTAGPVAQLGVQIADVSSAALDFIVFPPLVDSRLRLVVAAHVIGAFNQSGQLGAHRGVFPLGVQGTLREIRAPLKAVRVNAEQRASDIGAKGIGGLSGGEIKQAEFILCLPCAEGPLHPEPSRGAFEFKTAAEGSASPGLVFFALVEVQIGFSCGGESVKHGFDEDRQGAFSPAVFPADGVQTVRKIERKIVKRPEILYFQPQQLHSSASSPRRTRSPQAITRSFSDSSRSDAST